ncbi:MAG: peptidylprolyl isomerase [Phycisphaerae bacterium]|nr:peptidylprolyl isomerase [Phycisphaerae bacterium]NUQ45670.1 peptidylprolyl isomerase [Phycisphaerae bacterium]
MTRVVFQTSVGAFTIELDAQRAPVTVANFLRYVDEGFYADTIVHRAVPGFVIQMGGYDERLSQKKTNPPIANEWKNGLKNVRGTLSMARTADPNSATSQFFVNLSDNDNLDQPVSGGAGYAVFGRVVAGMDVIDKIAVSKTRDESRLGGMPCPQPMVRITSATREAAGGQSREG